MKKLILSIVVILAIVAVALTVYLKKSTLGHAKAARLVPANTVALVEVTDLERTKVRWKETALYKIAHEPEVAAFLEKPKSKMTAGAADARLQRARNLDVKEAFIALTDISGKEPKAVAGFDYKGKRADAEALVADIKKDLRSSYPASKADIVKTDLGEIETFDYDGTVMSSIFKDNWFFVSNDIELLKSTLLRLEGKTDAKTSLLESDNFKKATAKLPADSDGILYVDARVLIDKFGGLLAFSNPAMDPAQMEELKKVQAVTAAVKLDGEKIRDAIYILKPGGSNEPVMPLNSMAFTSSDTLVYVASILNLSGKAPTLPNPALDSSGLLAVLDGLRQTLEQAGLTYADFRAAFGPEVGGMVNWKPDTMQPALLLSLDVKDKAKALQFIETFSGKEGGFSKQEIEGVNYYAMPQAQAGVVAVTPVFAVTDKALLFGLNPDSVKAAVQGDKTGTAKLDKTAGYQSVSSLVTKPTGAYGYIDSKALFENVYKIAVNALRMVAMFNPHASDNVDLGKLPSTESISKYLSPIVYSQSADSEGILIESSGPVTFTQGIIGLGAGSAVFGLYGKESATPKSQFQPVPTTPSTVPPQNPPVDEPPAMDAPAPESAATPTPATP